jgi:hypothetical protein
VAILTRLATDIQLREKKSSSSDDPNQVRIHVVEEMTFGEKIGG